MWKENADNRKLCSHRFFGKMCIQSSCVLFVRWKLSLISLFLSSTHRTPQKFRQPSEDHLIWNVRDLEKKNNIATASVRVCQTKRDHNENSELSLSFSSQKLRTTFVSGQVDSPILPSAFGPDSSWKETPLSLAISPLRNWALAQDLLEKNEGQSRKNQKNLENSPFAILWVETSLQITEPTQLTLERRRLKVQDSLWKPCWSFWRHLMIVIRATTLRRILNV